MQQKYQGFNVVFSKSVEQILDQTEQNIGVQTLKQIKMEVAVQYIFYFSLVLVFRWWMTAAELIPQTLADARKKLRAVQSV